MHRVIPLALAVGCASGPDRLAAPQTDPPSRSPAGPSAPQVAGRPFFVLQTGHAAPVWSVDWSPNGRLLLSASADRTVKVIDVTARVVRANLHGHAGEVKAATWSPDGALLASAGADGAVRIWDAHSGAAKPSPGAHEGGARSIAWSGETLVSGGADGTVRLWDAAQGAAIAQIAAGAPVTAVAVDPRGERLAVTCERGATRIFDLRSRQVVREIPGHEGGTLGVAWSPDGSLLATAGEDRTARIWDASSAQRRGFLGPHDEAVSGLAWSPDGSTVATADGIALRLWNPATGAIRRAAETLRGVAAVRFSPDGAKVASACWDGSIRIWEVAAGREGDGFAAEDPGASSVAWSPDGAILASGTWDGAIVLWDAQSGAQRLAVDVDEGRVVGLRFSKEGSRLSSLRRDGTVDVWEVQTGVRITSIEPPGADVLTAAWSPDARRIATGDADGLVRVHDARSGAQVRSARAGGRVLATDWSPDGATIAAATTEGEVVLLDARSGERRGALPVGGGGVFRTLYSPDGSTIAAAASNGQVSLWDARTATPRARLGRQEAVLAISFSPDSRTLATTEWSGDLRLWDSGTGEPKGVLPGSEGALPDVAWSPDGGFVVTAGSTLRIHRLEDAASILFQRFALADRVAVLAHTDAGVFSGDDEAFENVVFRVGTDLQTAEVLSADQLFESFHRPSLVSDFLSGRPIDPAADVSDGVGLPPSLGASPPPPADGSSERLSLTLRADDRGGGVSEIRVFVNGSRVSGARGGGFSEGDPTRWEGEILLSAGENEIAAEAYSVVGHVRSTRLRWQVRLAEEDAARPDLHLLVVTLNDYDDPAQRLSYANADGDAVVEALRRQEGRLYGRVLAHRLRDAEATREAIEAAARDLRGVARTGDVLLFYAAGHGTIVRCGNTDRYHLLGYRSSLRSERTICEEGLSDLRLAELLRAIPARKKLLVLDTCQAGAAASAETLLALRGAEEIDAIKRLARAEGVAVVAAAKATEYAGEVPALGHGIFTWALLEGIRGAAARRGGSTVSVFGLLGYLEEHVARLSREHFQRSQYPITSAQGQDFPIAMAD